MYVTLNEDSYDDIHILENDKGGHEFYTKGCLLFSHVLQPSICLIKMLMKLEFAQLHF